MGAVGGNNAMVVVDEAAPAAKQKAGRAAVPPRMSYAWRTSRPPRQGGSHWCAMQAPLPAAVSSLTGARGESPA
jgi:hypothetical protein